MAEGVIYSIVFYPDTLSTPDRQQEEKEEEDEGQEL